MKTKRRQAKKREEQKVNAPVLVYRLLHSPWQSVSEACVHIREAIHCFSHRATPSFPFADDRAVFDEANPAAGYSDGNILKTRANFSARAIISATVYVNGALNDTALGFGRVTSTDPS